MSAFKMSPEKLSMIKSRAQSRHDFSVSIMEKLGNLFIGIGRHECVGGLNIRGEVPKYLARELLGEYKTGAVNQKKLLWITGFIASEVAKESMVDDSVNLFDVSVHGIEHALDGKVVDGPINAFIDYDICSSTWFIKYSVFVGVTVAVKQMGGH